MPRGCLGQGDRGLTGKLEREIFLMFGNRVTAMLAASLMVGLCSGAALAGSVINATRIASGLNRPVDFVSAPGDTDRMFIVEQPGIIRVFDLNSGQVLPTPFLDINTRVSNGFTGNGEQGLFSMAFHPNYFVDGDPNEGAFFVHYSANTGATVIERYRVFDNDPDRADANSDELVLTTTQPFSNHNGGTIAFGPQDGYLYVGLGDGGFFNDPNGAGQDIVNQLLGKILRLDVDGVDDFPAIGSRNYAIPPSNPFVDATGDDEIWAYGIRNPWRMSFDRLTNDLYIADVGQDAREEVNVQPADSPGGENYGWRCKEANGCTGLSGCDCMDPTLVDPVHQYFHSVGLSITGGYVYRGCEIPEIFGHYFFADFASARIWSFRVENGQQMDFTDWTTDLNPPDAGGVINQISSFGQDQQGNLYIVDRGSGNSSNQGQIFRIVPETPLVPDGDGPAIMHDGSNDTLFSGYIDPRAESTNGVDVDLGMTEITLTFDEPVVKSDCTLIDASDFSVRTTGGDALNVESIAASGNPKIVVKLDGQIPLQEWTTIEATVSDFGRNAINKSGDLGPGVNEEDRIDIAFLPADVDQSGGVLPLDLFRFRQIVNGVAAPDIGSNELYVDTDRNGSVSPLDLFRFRQLVGGTGSATRNWSEAPNSTMMSDQP